ncbi:MAG: DUF2442 domain-containing protein [Ruminococcus sp.]|nr:DUF2442 domain-containing protein [Ruminococcus sp.]
MKEIISVQPLENYHLLLEFDNGEKRKADISNLLEKPVFSFLKNINLFKSVYIEYGAVTWKNPDGNEVDICPDKLYMDSKEIGNEK